MAGFIPCPGGYTGAADSVHPAPPPQNCRTAAAWKYAVWSEGAGNGPGQHYMVYNYKSIKKGGIPLRDKNHSGCSVEITQETVPVHLKMTLTIKEAAAYSNIGINRLDALLRTPNCPFVLFVGTKKLVKRKEFEEFISKTLVI